MFKHKAHCKMCGEEAVYKSNRHHFAAISKKVLTYTCNDCLFAFLESRKEVKGDQLSFL